MSNKLLVDKIMPRTLLHNVSLDRDLRRKVKVNAAARDQFSPAVVFLRSSSRL